MACPICNAEGVTFRILSKHFIKSNLEKDYGERIPEDLGLIEYEMYKCKNCSLIFSSPMRPGSTNFYRWLTKYPGYYPTKRWDWDTTLHYIARTDARSILEIGCGNGVFLKKCADTLGLRVVGLDTNEGSAEACREIGIEAYCETIEEYSARTQEKFDMIVSFHCLEHVDDPKGFMRAQLLLLHKGGKILASTPYTATPGESWYETLNYPPHHMTQWNDKAYAELAKQLKLEVRLFMPRDRGLTRRALNSIHMMYDGINKRTQDTRKKIFFKIFLFSLLHPIKTVKEVMRHARRQKLVTFDVQNNVELKKFEPVGYVVLAEFVPKA